MVLISGGLDNAQNSRTPSVDRPSSDRTGDGTKSMLPRLAPIGVPLRQAQTETWKTQLLVEH